MGPGTWGARSALSVREAHAKAYSTRRNGLNMTEIILIEADVRDLGRDLAALPPDTRSLNLHANTVSSCPASFFARLAHLVVLDLSSNQLGGLRECSSLASGRGAHGAL